MPRQFVLLVLVSLLQVPLYASNDAVFSTSSDQYVATPDGGRTLRHSELSRVRSWIEPFGRMFVQNVIGLDAVDVLADGRVIFSSENDGLVSDSNGLVMLDSDRIYAFDPASGALSQVSDWNTTAIDLGPLDGLDRLDDGRYAFSIGEIRQVQDVDGTMIVYPENVYLLDSVSGRISTIFDGHARGLPDLDAVHVYGDGRVAVSFTEDCFFMTSRGGRTLDHNSVYIFDADRVTTAFDGIAHAIYTIDAVDLGETDVWVSLDRETVRWGTFAVAQGFDVVRGSVALLQATGGQFAASVDTCLAANDGVLEVSEQAVPEPGPGWFYLARRKPVGWWDTFGPGQVAPRAAIDSLQLCD